MLCGASLDFSDKYDNKVSNFTVRGIATSQRVDVVNITLILTLKTPKDIPKNNAGD